MKKKFILLSAMIITILAAVVITGTTAMTADAASAKTGAGLAQHALNAYKEGWIYKYGTAGQLINGKHYSDCSGLIYAYTGTARSSSAQYNSSSQTGPVSSIPRIHGLGLWQPGHVGVYVGNGMYIDNSEPGVNMRYKSVASKRDWQRWYKVPGVQYPTTGWVTYNGQNFYYENGQYLVNTTRTINGTTYTFGASGGIGTAVDTSQGGNAYSGSGYSGSSNKTTTTSNKVSAPAYATLKVDSRGDSVKKLQNKLIELGYYYESATGFYDYPLQDAVEAFQKVMGIKETGVADSDTQTKLYASSAKANPAKGSIYPGLHSSIVTKMQTRLKELGYFDADATGYYGDTTKVSVLAYQKESGLEETGTLDAAALEVLYSDSAVALVKPDPAVINTTAMTAVNALAFTKVQSEEIHDGVIPTVAAAAVAESEPQSPAANNGFVFFIIIIATAMTAILVGTKKTRVQVKETVSAMAGKLFSRKK